MPKLYDVKSLSDAQLQDHLQDWFNSVCTHFNGSPEKPRKSLLFGGMGKNGKHMCFSDFEKYCNSRGVYVRQE